MILKHKLIFDLYPLEIETSKGRKSVYWEYDNSDKLPLKYVKEIGVTYEWIDNILYHVETQEPVIKNINVINKPRTKQINGQLLHELKLKDYERSMILKILKNYYFSILKKYKKIEVETPIMIHLIFHINRKLIGDLDNHELFYKKTLFDCFVDTKIIRSVKNKKVIFEKIPNKYGFLKDDNVDNITDYKISWKNATIENRKIECLIYQMN